MAFFFFAHHFLAKHLCDTDVMGPIQMVRRPIGIYPVSRWASTRHALKCHRNVSQTIIMDLARTNNRLMMGRLGLSNTYIPTTAESPDESLDPDTPVADV